MAGYVRLVAVLNEPTTRLISNPLELEVFRPLRVPYPTLLLAPKCYTVVEFLDGPSVVDRGLVSVTPKVSDESVVQVQEISPKAYRVSALKKGVARIHFSVNLVANNKVLTEAAVSLEVAEITSAQISTLQTAHVGATFRVIAQRRPCLLS